MAQVIPFQPYRYSTVAGDLANLVTQPYDKITPAMRERYLSLSPYNLVRVILGEKLPDDTDQNNVYTRAAAYLDSWIRDGILAQDDAPGFYVYFQEFTLPDSDQRLTRKGFIGLGRLENYEAGIVHRHEQTLSGPKKDRTELLNHTRSHFGQIFMLYPDAERAVDHILDEVAAASEPDARILDEYGALHRLWRVADPARIEAIQSLMADKKLLIADGHHRYETALAYRNAHPEIEDARYLMMSFVNMYSDGLRILATHRAVSALDGFSLKHLLEDLSVDFKIVRYDNRAGFRSEMETIDPATVRIGLTVHDHPGMYVLSRPRLDGELDVRILHGRLLAGALGISEEAVRDEKHIRYYRGLDTAIDAPGAQLVFLLQPTPIDQMAEVSFSGGVMPQKSTDFYPKLLSGLAIYRLEK